MVCLGVITAPHGVRGQVRIHTFTETPEAVAAYGPVTDDAGRVWRLRLRGPCKGGVVAAIEGIGERDAAERLKGQKLHVARAALPEPEEETYYYSDLIGLEVRAQDGTRLGEVVAVHDFGAGDLIEIRLDSRRTVLLPFTAAAVPEVDVDAGHIVVAPAPELDGEDGRE